MPDTRFKLRIAAHVVLVRDGHILLLRRWNTGFSDGQYSLPTGHLEDNEEVIAAASREAREEVGIEIDPATSRVCGIMHRFRDPAYVYFFILAKDWSRSRIVSRTNAMSSGGCRSTICLTTSPPISGELSS